MNLLPVPIALTAATVKCAVLVAVGKSVAAGAISAQAADRFPRGVSSMVA
jgi:hypothetical protein